MKHLIFLLLLCITTTVGATEQDCRTAEELSYKAYDVSQRVVLLARDDPANKELNDVVIESFVVYLQGMKKFIATCKGHVPKSVLKNAQRSHDIYLQMMNSRIRKGRAVKANL